METSGEEEKGRMEEWRKVGNRTRIETVGWRRCSEVVV
jgi:hypothetical protein